LLRNILRQCASQLFLKIAPEAVADFAPMPKSQLAIVPSQGHVSLMMQTKTILGYPDGFLK